MELGLAGKVALVTGGSRGLGVDICRALAREGVRVFVNYRRDPEAARRLAADLSEAGGAACLAVKADITSETDVAGLFSEVIAIAGGVDILVNNAGICPVSRVEAMSLKEWKSVIDTNLTGAFLCSREAARRMPNGGRIIMITSQAGFNGSSTGKSHYAASKGGLTSFAVSLARELAPRGITVNSVAPGMLDTGMTAELLAAKRGAYAASIPLGRIGDAADVANAVVFLSSAAASYITGATIHVSGGMCMR